VPFYIDCFIALFSVPSNDKIMIPLTAVKTMDAVYLLLRIKKIILFIIAILS